MPVQGELFEADGGPVSGVRETWFRVYPSESATTPLWDELLVVNYSGGAFSAALGTAEVLDLDLLATNDALWLGVQSVGDPESPRVELGWALRAAWASRAGDADTLQGATRADLTYTAGTGLTLDTNNVFAADPTWVSAQAKLAAYDTKAELTAALSGEYRPATWVPQWSDIQGRPAGLDDGDDDLRYTAGAGVVLTGAQFTADPTWVDDRAKQAVYDTVSELTTALAGQYRPAAYVPAWTEITGRPTGLDDGDQNTTYSAGSGILLNGTTFTVDSTVARQYGAVGATIAVLEVTTDGAGTINYTAPNGTTYSLNTSTVAAGVTFVEPAGRLAYRRGATVAEPGVLWFNLTGATFRCTVLAYEDDNFNTGLSWFTDGGNAVSGVWGTGGVPTLGLQRAGVSTSPIQGAQAYAIACF